MAAEWTSLEKLNTWDNSSVQQWSHVRATARRANKRVHVGRIFGLCVEKGAELPEGDPQRKFKGRGVFQGDQVRDEDNYMATFQDLGSAPASISAGKMLILLVCYLVVASGKLTP